MRQLASHQWMAIQDEVQFKFIRSSGPGGQKVNKTASKAELRWNIQNSPAMEPEQKQQVLNKLQKDISADGEIVIQADTFRSRIQNREAALQRLKELVDSALFVPKKRRPTRPKKSAIRKRLQSKKEQGDKKRNRQKVDY